MVSQAPKRRKFLCVGELGKIHVPTCKDQPFGGGQGCPLAKLKGKRPHHFEIMSIIA